MFHPDLSSRDGIRECDYFWRGKRKQLEEGPMKSIEEEYLKPRAPSPSVVFGVVIVLWAISCLIVYNGGFDDKKGSLFTIINSLFSGLAFAGAIYNIFLQQNQLKIQQASSTKKDFEAILFQFFKQNESIVRDIVTNPLGGDGKLQGRHCFARYFYTKINSPFLHWLTSSRIEAISLDQLKIKETDIAIFKYVLAKNGIHWGENDKLANDLRSKKESLNPEFFQWAFGQYPMDQVRNILNGIYQNASEELMVPFFYERISEYSDDELIDEIKIIYDKFYEDNEHEIGYYFRNMFYILKYIDNALKDVKITYKEAKEYSNYFRAQLSKYEIIMLYFNCISKYTSYSALPTNPVLTLNSQG